MVATERIAKTPQVYKASEVKPSKKSGKRTSVVKAPVKVEKKGRNLARVLNTIYVPFNPIPPISDYFSLRHAAAHMVACGNLAHCVRNIVKMNKERNVVNITSQYSRTLLKNYGACTCLDGRKVSSQFVEDNMTEWELRMHKYALHCNSEDGLSFADGTDGKTVWAAARNRVISFMEVNYHRILRTTHKFIVQPQNGDLIAVTHFTVFGVSDAATTIKLSTVMKRIENDSVIFNADEALTNFCCGTRIEMIKKVDPKALLTNYLTPRDVATDVCSQVSGSSEVSLIDDFLETVVASLLLVIMFLFAGAWPKKTESVTYRAISTKKESCAVLKDS